MRYKLYFTLENEEFPIDYRRDILSYIKWCLSQYSNEEYKKLYNEKDPIQKDFTFSVFFDNPNINKDKILLKDKRFELNVSIESYEKAIILYNSFNNQKYKKFSINKNSFTLQSITMALEKQIDTNEINIKFLSPLCVRSRIDKKDYYYSYQNEKFEEVVKINIKEQLKISNLKGEIVDTFRIIPINSKKIVLRFYEKQIECSTGTFKIKGDKELLNYLYKSGIGSKHSCGFGMFQVI